ncbi:hypothetical protein GCM10023186_23030 [Hymenobacter koreensis]|uniref:PKD domain-containing protein n=2 Tax=Hymenobacter koreensis TaxID=1084523 RepID=A0ABP8J0A9_9BACT
MALSTSVATNPLVRNYGDQFRGDIMVDAADNVYVASNTTSANFPVRNSFQNTYAGGIDGVVSKLTPALTDVLWSSFLGGTGPDAAYSLQLDAVGRLFVSGGTASPSFPVRPGALVPTYGGSADGFVVRVSANGSTLEKSTFLGTPQYDQAYFLQLDASGQVYVLGQSAGTYPTTPGRYSNPNGRQFIHQLNADLSVTGFATVFGSGRTTLDLSPTAFLVDQCERIFVSGWGGGNNVSYGNGSVTGLPTTSAAVQPTTDGADFYLMQLSSGATTLEYATFFGGAGYQDHVDGGTSRFDRRGVIYHAVCAGCGGNSNFPIPVGANTYSTINRSTNCNNAAFKFNFEPERAIVGPARNACLTAGPQALTGTPAGGVWTGAGVSGSVATGFVFNPGQFAVGATTTLTYTVSTGLCQSQATQQVTIVAPPTAAFLPATLPAVCISSSPFTLNGSPAGGTYSGRGISAAGLFSPALAGAGTHTITYTIADGGCSASATVAVQVLSATAGASFSVCAPAPPTALAGTPAGGVWTGPGVTQLGNGTYIYTPPTAFTGTHQLTYTITGAQGCTSSSSLTVSVTPTPTAPVLNQAPLCVASTTPVALPGNAI